MTRKARHQIRQKFLRNLMFETNLMREESFLTDFQLICEDKEFLVHKVILSASSPYFKEYFKRNSQTTSLQIDFMNSKTLDTVLMFIYEGRIDLKNQSQPFLKDLLEAFITLKIPLMYNYCLEQLLGSQELRSQWNIIEQLNSDLIQQTYLEYLYKNFEALKTSNFFLNLNFNQIDALLKCSVLHLTDQDSIIDAVLLWVKHDLQERKQTINDLVEKIDFGKISDSCLEQLSEEPLLIDNAEVNKQIVFRFRQQNSKTSKESSFYGNIAMRSKSCNSDANKKSITINDSEVEQNMKSQRKYQKKTILLNYDKTASKSNHNPNLPIETSRRVVGYKFNGNGNTSLLEYNLETETWSKVQDTVLWNCFSRANYAAVCSFDNYIYYFGGGGKYGQLSNKCFGLDLTKNEIFEISPMKFPRWYAVARKLHHYIYVFGGCPKKGITTVFQGNERYNLTTKSWEIVKDLPVFENHTDKDTILSSKYHFIYKNIIAVDDRFCIVGNTHLFWYDPERNEWQEDEEPLPETFPDVSVTYANGKLFIVKGNPCCIHSFDLKNKIWEKFSGMIHNFNPQIFHLPIPDRLEFLLLGRISCFLYSPPSKWKFISDMSVSKLRLITIAKQIESKAV